VEELGIDFWQLEEVFLDGGARGSASVILFFREMAILHVCCPGPCLVVRTYQPLGVRATVVGEEI
jgi:hypothetical protein